MLKKGLKALGQSLLVVTGVGYGVTKALNVFTVDKSLGGEQQPAQPVHAPDAPNEVTIQRLVGLETRLIRMEKNLHNLASPLLNSASAQAAESRRGAQRPAEQQPTQPQPVPDFVTRDDLNAAINKLAMTLESGIETRFEAQDRSVQSLRTMMNRTDELLEQVLESIESNNTRT